MQDILNIENIFQTKSLAIATDIYLSEKLDAQSEYNIQELELCNNAINEKLKEVEIGLSHDVVANDVLIKSIVMKLLNVCVELHHVYQYFIRDVDVLISRIKAEPEFKLGITTQYLAYLRSGVLCFDLTDRLLKMYEHRISTKQSRALEWMLSGRCIKAYRNDCEFYRSMVRGNKDYQSKVVSREDAKHKVEVYLPMLLNQRNGIDGCNKNELFKFMPVEQVQYIREQTTSASDAILAAGVCHVEYTGSLNSVLGLGYSCCIHVGNPICGVDYLEVFLEHGVFWNFAKGTVEVDLNTNGSQTRSFMSGLLASLTFISINYHDVYFTNIDEFYCSRFL